MASHDPLGYLQHKLWSKKGPGVKLPIWLLTTKSQESTWPGVYRWSATHRWKDLEENYKFVLNLIPIRGLSWELWAPKVAGVQTGTVSRLLLGSPRNKSHLDVGVAEQCREYYMGEGGDFPQVRAVVSQVSSCCPWLVPTPRVFPKVN
jgi:hypothetical protein